MDDMQSRLADLSPEKRALLAKRLRSAQTTPQLTVTEPIAIIGMSCRFPGGANDLDSFWQLLITGGDAVSEIPPDRWDADAFYHPNADVPGKITSRWGGFLERIDEFDAEFFSISPREAMHMDPQQRLALEVVWEALEHAGQSVEALSGSQTGVFMGVSGHDYQLLQYVDGEHLDMYSGTGTAQNIVAGRISYLFDFRGPSIAIDTACSSSLTAVHVACQSLRANESQMAIAGGVNIILSSTVTSGISRMHMLANDGRCKTFDAGANGFVRSEGCGVVVLKRLSDALRDGDQIMAVIRGSAVNQDGRSASLTAPNGQAQQALLRQALQAAQLSPDALSYIETHGTGTVLGDPIEVDALAQVLGAPTAAGRPCALGALKTNLGHLEAAAGIAGLIKTVLALQHATIPANLHFHTLNPHIALAHTRFTLPTASQPWPAGSDRRVAGVSSFGWSGTNVHVIVEEAPAQAVGERTGPGDEGAAPVLVPLTARSAPALRTLAERYRALLASPCAPALADLAYTASCRRTRHAHRLSLAGRTPAALVAQLDAFLADTAAPGLATGVAPAVPPKLAFVIPGQGAQWPTMAQRLVQHEPAFAQAFAACAAACQPFLAVSLLDLLHAPTLPTAIDQLQPLLFAISVSLAALWRSWGVLPDAVVGHSMGEIAAACIAGALSLEDAAQIVCRRSQLLRTVSGQGAMAVVELSWTDTAAAIAPYADQLAIAVSTTARSTVIAGDPTALDAVLAQLDAQQVFTRRVNVDVASHSPQMDPLAPALRQALAGIQPRAGQVPLYSTVEARVLRGAELDTDYWVRNLRAPVQFHQAITQLAADGVTLFVELSPHPLLLQAITTTLREQGQTGRALPSLRREDDEQLTLRDSLGALLCAGYPLDGRMLWPHGGRVVPLPAYPWQRERFWLPPAPRATPTTPTTRPAGEHPLLGSRMASAGQPGTVLWETMLSHATQPLLAEHHVHGLAVLPGAAYLELALAAAHAHGEAGPYTLSEVAFRQLLHVAPDETRMLQLVLQAEAAQEATWKVYSRPVDADTWTHHASGKLRPTPPTANRAQSVDLMTIQARCSETVSSTSHYEGLAAQGLEYGPGFRGVQSIQRTAGEALGRVTPTTLVVEERAVYQLHPALLDAALQVLSATLPADETATFVPVAVAEVRVSQPLDGLAWSYARLDADPTSPEPTGDVLLLDAAGTVLLELRGLRLRRLAGPARATVDDWLYHLAWLPQALPTPPATATPPAIALVTTQPDAAQPLVAALAVHGVAAALLDATNDPAHLRTQLLALPQPCRHLVVLADARPAESDDPLADALPRWEQLATLLQTLVPLGWRDLPRLWLVTCATQAVTPADQLPHLAAAPLWGLARTLRYEHPELRPTLLDLPDAPLAAEAAALAAELLADAPDDQLALRPTGRFVARLQRLDLSLPSAPPRTSPAGTRPFRLVSDRPGVLDALTLREVERPLPGPGEVEIQVAATSLNFIDVLTALGTYPGQAPGQAILGHECAGIITALGPGVDTLRVGDAVVACVSGSLGTYVTAPALEVLPKPEHLSFEEAAGIPMVFATAFHALHDLARLQAGERVLIHSAAGGVGWAAVQLARAAGAEVLATAGTPEKRAWLQAHGITHVFDSRSLAFAEQVVAATGGHGVDVVLNSLTGPAIPASLAALAPYGRFVEIGKHDIFQNAALHLAPFRKSLAYFALDLAGLRQRRPAQFQALLHAVMQRIADGTVAPAPTTAVPVAEAAHALHIMARGGHIGKMVVTFAERADTPIAPAARPTPPIRTTGSYLITGGLGGLGLTVAQWLVEQGARTLVLLGRRAPSSAAQAVLDQLEAAGVTVRVIAADVADAVALAALLADMQRALPPLRGIFHAAGVLDDGLFLQQTTARFAQVAAPKLTGAWHLHTLTRHLPLDHFVLFSSGAALLGSPGQSPYAAANAALDALALARHAQGLPALSINWGGWQTVGLAAAQANRGERLADRGIGSMTPAQGLAALDRLLRQPHPQVAVLPFNFRQWQHFYPRVAAAPVFADLAQEQEQRGGEPQQTSSIRETLGAAEVGQRRTILENYLRNLIAQVLRLDATRITIDAPFNALGFDSLMAIEFRNQLELRFGLTLPTTIVWAYPTIAVLTSHLAEKIGVALATVAAPPEPDDQAAQHQIDIARLEDLSDDEAEALLLEKLESITKRALT